MELSIKSFSMPSLVYLGLGSNQGDRHALLEQAVALLVEKVGTVVARSSIIESEPWGFTSPNKFLNMVVSMETSLSPSRLLTVTQRIERQLGRTHKSTPLPTSQTPLPANLPSNLPFNLPDNLPSSYSDRPIDIDILLYADRLIHTPRLTVPHPLMLRREFVWRPLLEIAPDILWPPTAQPLRDVLNTL